MYAILLETRSEISKSTSMHSNVSDSNILTICTHIEVIYNFFDQKSTEGIDYYTITQLLKLIALEAQKKVCILFSNSGS